MNQLQTLQHYLLDCSQQMPVDVANLVVNYVVKEYRFQTGWCLVRVIEQLNDTYSITASIGHHVICSYIDISGGHLMRTSYHIKNLLYTTSHLKPFMHNMPPVETNYPSILELCNGLLSEWWCSAVSELPTQRVDIIKDIIPRNYLKITSPGSFLYVGHMDGAIRTISRLEEEYQYILTSGANGVKSSCYYDLYYYKQGQLVSVLT